MYSKLENKFHCCLPFLLLSQLQENEVVCFRTRQVKKGMVVKLHTLTTFTVSGKF